MLIMTPSNDNALEGISHRSYQVILVNPPGYAHAGCIQELAETTFSALKMLGLKVQFGGEYRHDEQQIIYGAHLLDDSAANDLPIDAVIYNTEQVTSESHWIGSAYLNLLKSRTVWDYSARNVERLRALGVKDIAVLPVGYVPDLSRIRKCDEDIDVLFYGSLNERREKVLDALSASGLNVVKLFGVYGTERDEYIARAKLVLNLHYYESKVFEIVRVSYLLANSKAVVAECGADTEVEADIIPAVCCAAYGDLVPACQQLLNDASARRELGERGHAIFSKRQADSFLAAMLSQRKVNR